MLETCQLGTGDEAGDSPWLFKTSLKNWRRCWILNGGELVMTLETEQLENWRVTSLGLETMQET